MRNELQRRIKIRWEIKKGIIAYRYNFTLDDSYKSDGDLKIKEFKTADIEWIKFVLACRKSNNSPHDYDIVIGPTADANAALLISSFLNTHSSYSEQDLLDLVNALEPHNLSKQYFFNSYKALSYLRPYRIWKEIVWNIIKKY